MTESSSTSFASCLELLAALDGPQLVAVVAEISSKLRALVPASQLGRLEAIFEATLELAGPVMRHDIASECGRPDLPMTPASSADDPELNRQVAKLEALSDKVLELEQSHALLLLAVRDVPYFVHRGIAAELRAPIEKLRTAVNTHLQTAIERRAPRRTCAGECRGDGS